MGVRTCSDSCFHAEGEDAGRGQGRLNVFNMFLVTNLYFLKCFMRVLLNMIDLKDTPLNGDKGTC